MGLPIAPIPANHMKAPGVSHHGANSRVAGMTNMVGGGIRPTTGA
eukprot:CAMPEP_0195543102 /NCGR_PEP_ID=MMETSP0794_2-20130614/51948_1 /TAXON_ID=515487 /ORGANISM="Stephanopyxis turris, Strain CCMP 815" /LENGTH=44 /DNA_ID= /DNA_START= /DNA_END= /DNA_ORIENTATION=